jgi:hypothetical protein
MKTPVSKGEREEEDAFEALNKAYATLKNHGG